MYFVCSALKLKEPVAGSKGTQEELLEEAKLEVEELKHLVTQYLRKQSPKRKTTAEGKISVCVMFPTRLTVSTCACALVSAATVCCSAGYTFCVQYYSICSPHTSS